MKTIYEIYVLVTSQEQADRLKSICLEYGLPISPFRDSFEFYEKQITMYFRSVSYLEKFYVSSFKRGTQITESEFELLAKEFKQ